MKKVDINYFDYEKNEEVETTISIRPARVREYKKLAKIVGRVTRTVKNDPEVVEAIQAQLFGVSDDSWKDKEMKVLMEDVQKRLESGYIGMIGFAFEYLPDELTELISALTNQDIEIVDGMDEDSLFGTVEAIIEVNDLGKLKDSFMKFYDAMKVRANKEKAKADHREHIQDVTR